MLALWRSRSGFSSSRGKKEKAVSVPMNSRRLGWLGMRSFADRNGGNATSRDAPRQCGAQRRGVANVPRIERPGATRRPPALTAGRLVATMPTLDRQRHKAGCHIKTDEQGLRKLKAREDDAALCLVFAFFVFIADLALFVGLEKDDLAEAF